MKKTFIASLPAILVFVFYDYINNLFGIYLEKIPYDINNYPVLLMVIVIFITFVIVSFIFMQKSSLSFEKALIKRNEYLKQRELLLKESNEELITVEEEIRQNMEELWTLNESLEDQKQEIINNEKKYKVLFNNINDAVLIIDNGRFVECNKSAVKMIGYKNAEDLINTLPADLSPEFQSDGRLSSEKAPEMIAKAIEKGVNKFEWTHKRANGTTFSVEVWLTKIEYDDKTLIHTVWRDLTMRKKANEKIKDQFVRLNKQKKVIEAVHKDITDSINYAKTIQDALLTKKELINDWINDYFIIFKPKEHVSGDFYYVNKIGNELVFSVADCTGHGVPGGFMTMLGITYLHEITRQFEVVNPGDILNLLRERIKSTFRTFGSKNENGLDIAFCTINTKKNILKYSGAFNPLYIVRNNELLEYKATRNPIGYYPEEEDFSSIEIELVDQDLIYIFSDGYQDQFGGANNKKFSKKRFKDLLLEIHKEPLKEQEKILKNRMLKWQNDIAQIDDITIMGVKWSIVDKS